MHDPHLPIVIRKHWFGLFIIYTIGIGLFVALTVLPALYVVTGRDGSLDSTLRASLPFLVIAGILALLFTLVAANVYSESKVVIDVDKLVVDNQLSLFADRGAELEWRDVEDVTETHGGIFATLFGYGTLQVQTAGTREQFIFTMCPRVVYWRDVILQQHELSTGI